MKRVTLACLIVFITSQCAHADAQRLALLKDMVSFDQAYIPALVMSAQQKPGPSRKAMFLLQMRWEVFDMRYATLFSDDSDWRRGFMDVGNALKTAERHIRSAQWLEAHEVLEPIRVILKDLRMRKKIDYFIDDLTAFHEMMEPIVKMAEQKENLSPADIAQIKTLHDQASAFWAHIETRPFDDALFGFDNEKIHALKEHIAQERDVLTALDAALHQGNANIISIAAQQIKPPFAQTFMLFGDFKSVQ